MSRAVHVNTAAKSAMALRGNSLITVSWDKNKEQLQQTLKKNPDKQGDIALWGSDNLFPQTLAKLIEESELIPQIIDTKAKAIYSGGIVYGEEYVDEDDGETHFVRRIHPEIERVLEDSDFAEYVLKASEEYYSYGNIYAQMSFNVPRNKIVHNFCHDGTECRLSIQNEAGFIDRCFINANWEDGGSQENSITVAALDPHQNVLEQILNGKDYTYILPIRTLRRGHKFYGTPLWDGLRISGWLDIAKEIPQAKKALMEHGLKIRHHVKINNQYWEWKFGRETWEDFSPEEKTSKIEEELDTFYEVMSSKDQSNALVTQVQWDEVKGQEIPGWTVETLKNDLKGGEYITDLQEINAVTLRAFGVDPTIFGSGPGKDKTSGSGSDKRVAFNQLAIKAKPDFERIIRPWKITAEVNKWHDLIKRPDTPENSRFAFRTENYRIATMDTGAEIQNIKE